MGPAQAMEPTRPAAQGTTSVQSADGKAGDGASHRMARSHGIVANPGTCASRGCCRGETSPKQPEPRAGECPGGTGDGMGERHAMGAGQNTVAQTMGPVPSPEPLAPPPSPLTLEPTTLSRRSGPMGGIIAAAADGRGAAGRRGPPHMRCGPHHAPRNACARRSLCVDPPPENRRQPSARLRTPSVWCVGQQVGEAQPKVPCVLGACARCDTAKEGAARGARRGRICHAHFDADLNDVQDRAIGVGASHGSGAAGRPSRTAGQSRVRQGRWRHKARGARRPWDLRERRRKP